jgi:cell division protein FtsL
MNNAEKVLIAIAILTVLAVGGLALYVAIKAHLHNTTLAAEVANQKGKVTNLETSAQNAVQADLAAAKAKIASLTSATPPAPPAP